jgi:rare lipoprotein A
MNQRHLWTIVALSLAVLGTPSVGRTQTTKATTLDSQKSPASDVVKVGEFQSSAGKLTSDAVITSIHPHNIGSRQAATLFIRNIPVLTFLSSKPVASVNTKVGVIGDDRGVQSYAPIAFKSAKVESVENITDTTNSFSSVQDDPVQRAGLIAARVNQLIRENVDANQITVSWKGEGKSIVANQAQNKSNPPQQHSGDGLRPNQGVVHPRSERYTIKIDGQELVEVNADTLLADSTKNLAQDALQATNRLRRLIGNASPLNEIANLPTRVLTSIARLPQEIAIGGVRISFKGIASYYGYDGSGNQTASGERFNPEGMTAAHRSLPLGTQVRVTNTRNGRSVVLRINDRGPYIRGRIIDVSAGAARLLGMIGSGVAPVHIQVLGR